MKRTALLLLMAFSLTASAQRRRKPVEPVFDVTPEQAIAAYDFNKAEEILNAQIDYLEKTQQPTDEKEALLEIVRKNLLKLQSTACVTFIDSIVLPKSLLLSHLLLGSESGSVESASKLLGTPDSLGCTLYLNQLENKRLFAAPNAAGHLRLYGQELIGGEWTKALPLDGLGEEDEADMNFPFMLDDGVTLYFAACSEEGLGGYDIYMTRYDTDEHTFLAPENVGMPFNSPANDYLYVVDEFNNLGYFATDRNQPADSVCLYTFIPSQTRRVYNEENVGRNGLRRLARIQSIRETWTDKADVAAAQKRLAEVRNGEKQEQKAHDFDFILNDRHVYTTLSDFRSDEARKLAVRWLETKRDNEKTTAALRQLREQYAAAPAATKQQLAPQIRIMEAKAEQLYSEQREQEKQIRKRETVN